MTYRQAHAVNLDRVVIRVQSVQKHTVRHAVLAVHVGHAQGRVASGRIRLWAQSPTTDRKRPCTCLWTPTLVQTAAFCATQKRGNCLFRSPNNNVAI